jgi:hypothetical protein
MTLNYPDKSLLFFKSLKGGWFKEAEKKQKEADTFMPAP